MKRSNYLSAFVLLTSFTSGASASLLGEALKYAGQGVDSIKGKAKSIAASSKRQIRIATKNNVELDNMPAYLDHLQGMREAFESSFDRGEYKFAIEEWDKFSKFALKFSEEIRKARGGQFNVQELMELHLFLRGTSRFFYLEERLFDDSAYQEVTKRALDDLFELNRNVKIALVQVHYDKDVLEHIDLPTAEILDIIKTGDYQFISNHFYNYGYVDSLRDGRFNQSLLEVHALIQSQGTKASKKVGLSSSMSASLDKILAGVESIPLAERGRISNYDEILQYLKFHKQNHDQYYLLLK